ncbi:putrescine aminopropyltransferase [Dispira simplex]|nr:putrescine aminopropyltransferase [Dispira simplex]
MTNLRTSMARLAKNTPVEAYPLVAVVTVALTYGTFSMANKLLMDPDIRRRGATGSHRYTYPTNNNENIGTSSIRDGWFIEEIETAKGQALCIQVKEILHQERSPYQDILVFESTNHGNVLVLDGIIQCTERDECAYQEVITHTPLNCHPNPQKVLVIGGGDGGVLREVVKHDVVEEVVLCEIDEVSIH